VLVSGAACSPLVSYPEQGPEQAACEDGVDNDLDGQTDCDDPDCASRCNRCGEVQVVETDELGRVCARDCECPDDFVCNPNALDVIDGALAAAPRCAPEPILDDDSFDIAFTVEDFSAPGSDARSGRQNVLGRVRFNGVETGISSAAWDLTSQSITFAAAPETGQRSVLFVFSFPIPSPRPFAAEAVTISDAVEADSLGQVQQRGQFGPVPLGAAIGDLALNQVAVVEASTITFDPVSQVPGGLWRGRYTGRLRGAAGFDRWSACPTDRVYDAEAGACVEPPGDEALFYLACAYRPDAPRGRGEVAFSWQPPWAPRRQSGSSGECAARREDDRLRVRGAVVIGLGVARAWVLELDLPRFSAVADSGLRVGPTEAVAARVWETELSEIDRESALLDLDLGPPDLLIRGRMRIDDQREGPNGRFLGWVRGQVVEPPSAP